MLGSCGWGRAAAAALVLVAGTLAGCGADSGGEADPVPEGLAAREGLTPTYAPTTTTGGSGETVPTTGTATTGAPQTTTSTTSAGAGTAHPAAALTDPRGDATPGEGEAPAWADLVGGRLVLMDSHYELRVDLGDAAPTSSGGADRTMNVAAFFDVDGDGQVDYEIWANLSDGGWDGSWFDDRTGAAAHSDAAATDVLVDGGQLVVRFSPDHVGGALRFRWSLASEYGRYATLGTQLTTRDDAPDGDVAVPFPA